MANAAFYILTPLAVVTPPPPPPPPDGPQLVGRLARHVSVQHGRVFTGERDVTVHERSDRRDGSRMLIEYLHSSLVDTGTPSRDPFFMAVQGTRAVVDVVLDYALSTLNWSVLSADWAGQAVGPFHGDGWGHDISTSKMELGRVFGGTRPDGQGAGGMGANVDKILLVGYSHGGPLAMNYVRRFPTRVAGVLLFHPAVNLDALRGTDAAHPGGSPTVWAPGGFYADINGAYGITTDAEWAAVRDTNDPSRFDWSTIADLPPVLDFVSDDDLTLGPIAGNQDLFPAAYGPRCSMVTLPNLPPAPGANGHFSGGFAATVHAVAIHQFIDALTV